MNKKVKPSAQPAQTNSKTTNDEVDEDEDFTSELLERLDNIKNRLKNLSVEMFTRGLSTRDNQTTLSEDGGKPLVSRSEASRMSDAL